jgi:uncharacterized protein YcaQ
MSIYPTEDWPQFAYYRKAMQQAELENSRTAEAAKLLDWVRKEIERRGPLSSLELKDDQRIDWWLTDTVRAVRVTLDLLLYGGELVVHHRTNTRRYFDLSRRVLPAKLFKNPKPFASEEEYKDWHVYRRLGSVGLAHMKNDNKWIGILGWQSIKIRASIRSLAARGQLVPVAIEGLPREEFYVRRVDFPALQAAERPNKKPRGAAFLAPLDNLIWQRAMLNLLFDFDYVWEVYIPAPKRKWGYYVLPVLYGDRMVARLDPAFDRNTKTFVIQNWWWQPGVDKKDEAMLAALQACVKDFCGYLGASGAALGDKVKSDRTLKKVIQKAV